MWNLSRGCGLRGLGGISPAEGDTVRYIRPLLCVQRCEIEAFLQEKGISYCTDETNLEDHYTRNRIRNHVIPYLEQEINPQAVMHMSETMEQMRAVWGVYGTGSAKMQGAICGKAAVWECRRSV